MRDGGVGMAIADARAPLAPGPLRRRSLGLPTPVHPPGQARPASSPSSGSTPTGIASPIRGISRSSPADVATSSSPTELDLALELADLADAYHAAALRATGLHARLEGEPHRGHRGRPRHRVGDLADGAAPARPDHAPVRRGARARRRPGIAVALGRSTRSTARRNFVRGIPVWATLIALTHDGEPVVGVVSAPALGGGGGRHAGCGAFADGRPCRVSRRRDARRGPGQPHVQRRVGRARAGAEPLVALQRRRPPARGFGDFWQHCSSPRERSTSPSTPSGVAPYDLAAVPMRGRGGRRHVHRSQRRRARTSTTPRSAATACCTRPCSPHWPSDGSARREQQPRHLALPGATVAGDGDAVPDHRRLCRRRVDVPVLVGCARLRRGAAACRLPVVGGLPAAPTTSRSRLPDRSERSSTLMGSVLACCSSGSPSRSASRTGSTSICAPARPTRLVKRRSPSSAEAGATAIRRVDENGQWWMVMGDPEGNEFCVT